VDRITQKALFTSGHVVPLNSVGCLTNNPGGFVVQLPTAVKASASEMLNVFVTQLASLIAIQVAVALRKGATVRMIYLCCAPIHIEHFLLGRRRINRVNPTPYCSRSNAKLAPYAYLCSTFIHTQPDRALPIFGSVWGAGFRFAPEPRGFSPMLRGYCICVVNPSPDGACCYTELTANSGHRHSTINNHINRLAVT